LESEKYDYEMADIVQDFEDTEDDLLIDDESKGSNASDLI